MIYELGYDYATKITLRLDVFLYKTKHSSLYLTLIEKGTTTTIKTTTITTTTTTSATTTSGAGRKH